MGFTRAFSIVMVALLLFAASLILSNKSKANKVALKFSVLILLAWSLQLLFVGVGTQLRNPSIWGFAIIVILVIPVIYMFNFALFVAVFDTYIYKIEGNLKTFIALSIISLCAFCWNYLFEYEVYVFSQGLPIYLQVVFRIAMTVIMLFWLFSTLVIYIIMLRSGLKFAPDSNKKKWLKIAFFLPIIGSALCLYKAKRFYAP